jgi:hypothetical protein
VRVTAEVVVVLAAVLMLRALIGISLFLLAFAELILQFLDFHGQFLVLLL